MRTRKIIKVSINVKAKTDNNYAEENVLSIPKTSIFLLIKELSMQQNERVINVVPNKPDRLH